MIHAKQSIAIDASAIANSSDGNVLGKSSDDTVIAKDGYCYIKFSFDGEVKKGTLNETINVTPVTNEAKYTFNAVGMTKWNRVDSDLYVTFKQITDKIGDFSKFKLLLFNNGDLIYSTDGYFSVYAENLNGKDSTDVASLWVYSIGDFDKIEYYYEP